MTGSGQILIVDDDSAFTTVSAKRLSSAGYEVRVVSCAGDCIGALRDAGFDVLVASDQVEGNEMLELIEGLPRYADGVEAVVVTSSPEIHNLTRAFQLQVAAYMIKPLALDKPMALDELIHVVEKCVQQRRLVQSIRSSAKEHVEWHQQLVEQAQNVAQISGNGLLNPLTIGAILKLSMQNIAVSMAAIQSLIDLNHSHQSIQIRYEAVDGKREATLTAAIYETIDVLERTKTAFKSKELGNLRRKLESLVAVRAEHGAWGQPPQEP